MLSLFRRQTKDTGERGQWQSRDPFLSEQPQGQGHGRKQGLGARKKIRPLFPQYSMRPGHPLRAEKSRKGCGMFEGREKVIS